MSKGWILLHRQMLDCFIWDSNEPHNKRSAWVDLLLLANHQDKEINFNGKPTVIKRGQYLTSVRQLADRWHWSNDKVLRFLRLLESKEMLNRESDNFRTLLTVVNYDFYQTMPNSDKYTDEYTDEYTDKSQTKNEKNVKNVKNIIPLAPSDVFIQLILNDGSVFEVSKASVSEMKELYPSVDVEQELRNMKGWLNGNPTKRKTRSGINRFINSWLAREQNKGGSAKTGKATSSFNNMAKNDYDFSAIEKMLGV